MYCFTCISRNNINHHHYISLYASTAGHSSLPWAHLLSRLLYRPLILPGLVSPHPTAAGHISQVVCPHCRWASHITFALTYSPLHNKSAPSAFVGLRGPVIPPVFLEVWPAHSHFNLLILQDKSVTLVLWCITSLWFLSIRETQMMLELKHEL